MAGEQGIRRARLVRHDGLFWRRLAYAGSVHGPHWWRTGSPPFWAVAFYAALGARRRAVRENLRRVLGRGSFWSEHRAALRTFIEFAYVLEETLEVEGLAVHGSEIEAALGLDLEVQWPEPVDVEGLLAEKRGIIVLTSHFGCWEIGARAMQSLGRPVNLVMATEENETVEQFAREKREQHGLRVIHSDRSPFASVEMLRALERGEIVAIQLDRAAPGQVTEPVEFFGAPAPFQLGPFVLAKSAGVPIWPVYTVRTERGKFRILPERPRYVEPDASRAELVGVLRDVVQSFEQHVRRYPHQWFQFQSIWDAC